MLHVILFQQSQLDQRKTYCAQDEPDKRKQRKPLHYVQHNI